MLPLVALGWTISDVRVDERDSEFAAEEAADEPPTTPVKLSRTESGFHKSHLNKKLGSK